MAKTQSTIDGEAETRYLEQAIAESETACGWVENYCLRHDVFNLGKKVGKTYREHYDQLKLPNDVCRLAIKYFWIAQRVWEIRWAMNNSSVLDSNIKENRKHSEAFEFLNVADNDRGEAFYFFLSSISLYENTVCKSLQLKLGITQDNSDRMQDLILESIALYWICQADEMICEDNIFGALDAMNDAFSALHNSKWNGAWHTGIDHAKDTHSWEAKRKAEIRHIETHKKRQQIVAYWRTNIPLDKSNEFAAELLQKEFPEIAHRTLSRYVSKAKKEVQMLPPASTR